jgi:hypothetical protein
VDLARAVRLTGISAQELGGEAAQAQLGLFEVEERRPRRADRLNKALDLIASKFGAQAITTADLAGRQLPLEDEVDEEARRRVGAAKFDATE